MTDQPYTRDEIERILDSEKCRADDYETDRCHRHDGLMPLVGDSCTRKRSDLLAIIRQLLDQTDQLNALVGTVAEQAIHSRGEQVNDHMQAAKALMADRPDDGDVFAAQTHAMIAIAESLRSGTIERTETVTHYEPFQIPCERCAGSGTDPEARPDAQNRPQTAQEPESTPTATPEPERPQEGHAEDDEGVSGAIRTAASTPTRRARNRVTDALLAEVVKVYRDAWDSGGPPTKAVAEYFDRPHSTAARWVGEARRRGMLAPSDGSRGGEVGRA